jgi:hypothetical protein
MDKFISADNEGLVEAMQELVDRKNSERSAFLEQEFRGKMPLEWEFVVMETGKLTKDEQVRLAARTTVCFFFFVFYFSFLHVLLSPSS